MSALTVNVAQMLARVAAEHTVVPCTDSRRSEHWRRWDQCSGCVWSTNVADQHPKHVAAVQANFLADSGFLHSAVLR